MPGDRCAALLARGFTVAGAVRRSRPAGAARRKRGGRLFSVAIRPVAPDAALLLLVHAVSRTVFPFWRPGILRPAASARANGRLPQPAAHAGCRVPAAAVPLRTIPSAASPLRDVRAAR